MPVDYFTIRSRALASFLTAVLGALANLCTGALLDLPFSQRTKSQAVFLVTATAITASWIWNAVIQAELSTTAAPSAFDIGQTGSAASAFAVYMSKLFLLLSLAWFRWGYCVSTAQELDNTVESSYALTLCSVSFLVRGSADVSLLAHG